LADPSNPDLAATLRVAAAAITKKKRHQLPLWLEGGLFTRLLDILRGLPAQGLPPNLAAEICAAAATGVCNIISCAQLAGVALPHGVTPGTLLDEAGRVEVKAAVVHCGVVNTAAAGQLPPGREACLLDMANIPEAQPVPGYGELRKESFSRLFNTPRTPCIHLLLTTATQEAEGEQRDPRWTAALSRLLDQGILEHMLQMAIHAPLQSKRSSQSQHPHTMVPAAVSSGAADVEGLAGQPVRLLSHWSPGAADSQQRQRCTCST
jgi:hypothetical protein